MEIRQRKNKFKNILSCSKVVAHILSFVNPALCQIYACRDINLSLYYYTFTLCKDLFSSDPLHTLCFFFKSV